MILSKSKTMNEKCQGHCPCMSMWFATSIFDLATLSQISSWKTTLTFPPWGVYLLNTLQSYD